MSTPLRDAAIRFLEGKSQASEHGAIHRMSIDVELGGQLETVMLSFRDGALCCVSSDGRTDGPHVLAALRFIAATDGGITTALAVDGPAAAAGTGPIPCQELADALEDLLTAIARVGVDKARYAPSVDAAVERALEVAPRPTPPGLARFLGRLRQELETAELSRVARLLEGSSRLVEALRSGRGRADAEQRIRAWLGVPPSTDSKVDLLCDRTMVEVAREWLTGPDRARVERRYLVDVQSGRIYREDRPRSASASLGPCPRQLRVGLAELESGPAPQRVRILQYEVSLDISDDAWERLRQVASHSIAQVIEAYSRSVSAFPALSEPFAMIAPYRIESNDLFKALDADGHQLVLDRRERRGAALAFYELLAGGTEPTWIAGRLTDAGGTLCLVPFALGARGQPYIRL